MFPVLLFQPLDGLPHQGRWSSCCISWIWGRFLAEAAGALFHVVTQASLSPGDLHMDTYLFSAAGLCRFLMPKTEVGVFHVLCLACMRPCVTVG